jgi:ubiquinone/menaquinone biosynthesis C-methylase UbiE
MIFRGRAAGASQTAGGGPSMDEQLLRQMRDDWDQRARSNARHYIQTAQDQWEDRDFFRSGEINVANEVMPEMHRICGGDRSPLDLRALEIGCGEGRMTRMLARIFGQVTAIDVSSEMIARARSNLGDLGNVSLIHGDGCTLTGVGDETQDFAFSLAVFQHIPSREVISSYCREVRRVLRPGSLFKFQVQGAQWKRNSPPDTWTGVSVSEDDARRLCEESGFSWELDTGAGTQFYWLWFRKPLK